VWHRAAVNDSLEASETLLRFVKRATLNPDELMLTQNKEGDTALLVAVKENDVEMLKEVWVLAEKAQANATELKKKLLLAKEDEGFIVWHWVELNGSVDVLEMIGSWTKEVELKPDKFLLAQSEKGVTVFHMAAKKNHVGILE